MGGGEVCFFLWCGAVVCRHGEFCGAFCLHGLCYGSGVRGGGPPGVWDGGGGVCD